jgi:hypothetical protein
MSEKCQYRKSPRKEKAARKRLFNSNLMISSGRTQCWLALPAIGHEANASEAEKHHRPC